MFVVKSKQIIKKENKPYCLLCHGKVLSKNIHKKALYHISVWQIIVVKKSLKSKFCKTKNKIDLYY